MDSSKELDELEEEILKLPPGPQQIACASRAVVLADLMNDLDVAFETRMSLIDCANSGGRPDLVITTFAWCLAQSDADPERFDPWDLLWEYKWVISNIDDFPMISLEKIDALIEDMRQRYEIFDLSLKPYFEKLINLEFSRGKIKSAEIAYEKWQNETADSMSDCLACEIDSKVSFEVDLEKYEEAFKTAQPLISGEQKCMNVPAVTFAYLLLPCLHLGKLEDAKEFHRKGYRKIYKNPTYIISIGNHIEYLVIIGNIKRALLLFDRHISMAVKASSPNDRYNFYSICYMLFWTIQKNSAEKLSLQLPTKIDLHRDDGLYEIAELIDWFKLETEKVADQFDKRNGNDYYKSQITTSLKTAEQLADKLK